MEITVTNVNQALSDALYWLHTCGVEESSRNGPVLVSPEPVLTTYTKPLERVLFSPMRDANPFFHLMEALWMLGGRNDLAWPLFFNSKFGAYSDDGKTVNAAYGYRWRQHFGYDQLQILAYFLRQNPETRRVVLNMWDSCSDTGKSHDNVLQRASQDVPCNTHAYFDRRGDALNMTVCCRSNDAIWGAYGANAVHFSVLLEFMAALVGTRPGTYCQFSHNLHLYTGVVTGKDLMVAMARDADVHDHYTNGDVEHYPLMLDTDTETWQADLQRFLNAPTTADEEQLKGLFTTPFFRHVAVPMRLAWADRKTKRGDGMKYAAQIVAADWRVACTQWIERRLQYGSKMGDPLSKEAGAP